LVGMTIRSAAEKTGITALAIQKKGHVLKPNPAGDEIIQNGDSLIVIGTKIQLTSLEEAL